MVAEGGLDPDTRGEDGPDVIPEGIYDENSVGPSLRPICARCLFTMTNMNQVGRNFY